MPKNKKPRHNHKPLIRKLSHISPFTHIIETELPYCDLLDVAKEAGTTIDKCLVKRAKTEIDERHQHLPRIKA